MQKHIYFGPVDDDAASEFDTFQVQETEYHTGNYDFHMGVNVEDQFVRITDAIGRMIPVDLTQINSMIGALILAKDLMSAGETYVVDFEGDSEIVE